MEVMTDTIEAGLTVADITPERDRQTIYHRLGARPGDTAPILDRLFARATAFRNADRLAIWASLDICVLPTALRNQIVAELERQGIQADQVTLSSTHTHSAPTGHDFHDVEHLFAVAYSNNGEIGYVPSAAAFAEGGMAVDVSPYYYGLFQLAPECGEILVESALRTVQSVCDR